MNGASDEDQLVAEVLDTNLFQAGHTVERPCIVSFHVRGVNALARILLAGLQELNDVGHDDQLSGENGLVTGFGVVDDLASKDDIDRPWHRAGRNVARVLLEFDLLPVDHDAVLVDQFPPRLVIALQVRASDWLGVLELLLHVAHFRITFQAAEGASDQFWLGVSRSRDSTVDGSEATKSDRSEISDLSELGQVVNTHLEVRFLETLLLDVRAHDPGKSSVHIRLNSVVVLDDVLNELGVLVLEITEVAEVDVHGLLLVLSHLLGILCIVFKWFVIVAIGTHLLQSLIVFVVGSELKTAKRSKGSEISKGESVNLRKILSSAFKKRKISWSFVCQLYLRRQELVEVTLDFLGDGVSVGVVDFIIAVDDVLVHQVLSHPKIICANLLIIKKFK